MSNDLSLLIFDSTIVFFLPVLAILLGVFLAERFHFYPTYPRVYQYVFGVLISILFTIILYASSSHEPSAIELTFNDISGCQSTSAATQDVIRSELILNDWSKPTGQCTIRIFPHTVVGYVSPIYKYIATLIFLIFVGTISVELTMTTRKTIRRLAFRKVRNINLE